MFFYLVHTNDNPIIFVNIHFWTFFRNLRCENRFDFLNIKNLNQCYEGFLIKLSLLCKQNLINHVIKLVNLKI